MWKVILFAHDFSECAERVEPVVIQLARTHCARVVVCHVTQLTNGLSPQTVISPPGEEAPITVGEYTMRTGRERLAAIGKRIAHDCVEVETAVILDEIHTGILRAATDYRAEVIVMGTHGRTGLSHWLLGSVAEKVLRQAEVPVLTLRSHVSTQAPAEERVLEDEMSG